MPEIHTEEAPRGTKISVWEIHESLPEIIDKLVLTEIEEDFLEGVHPRRALEWAASRFLLRSLAGPETTIVCFNDASGRPFLQDDKRHISISHSHGMAAAGISNVPLGIDIQIETDKITRIADKFMSREERSRVDGPHSKQKLLACWSAKEAMFKLYGKGNVDFKSHLYVDLPQRLETYGKFNGAIRKTNEAEIPCIINYRFIRNYILLYALPQ